MDHRRMQLSTAAGILAASILGLACGGGTKVRVDDERLARLPAAEREELVDRERRLRIAEANLTAARVAASDAGAFVEIVETERTAAEERRDAARKAVELARSSNDRALLAESRRALGIAARQLAESDAKVLYAQDLKEVRDAEVEHREARVDLERADLELAKVDRLRARGQDEGLERAVFVRALTEASRREAAASGQIAGHRKAARDSYLAWRSFRRADEQTASQMERAPRPPRPIEEPE
jgi:hypothetical protein